ncbi:MAG: hypothetical protein IPI67_26885 [Myxococcales bacterium]|nr:hypothetical protein [Myxococcales bacterium]
MVRPFAEGELEHWLRGGSRASLYLFEYLTDLGAHSILVETRYVDRHFLDDFVSYYARSFRAPPPQCSRLHFFTSSPEDLLARLHAACNGQTESVERELQEAYLGFVVVRPLDGASIGRTVLKTYPIAGRRHYEVVRPYHVHLLGLRLRVDGLAYQQQDQGAAVCASTALWSALQRVARVAGYRTPTPSAITVAAKSPFPAQNGLTWTQMAEALNALGYVADVLEPSDNRDFFRAQMVACLRSQLPVILLLTKARPGRDGGKMRDGHAVTLTGFSEPATTREFEPSQSRVEPLGMAAAAVEVVYTHDDNLGSHAHYELRDSTDRDENNNPKLILHRGRTGKASTYWEPDDWEIEGALVPKPPKLRLSVSALFEELLAVRPVVDWALENTPVHWDVRFLAGVDYRRTLFDSGLDTAELLQFNASLCLPRNIGVITARLTSQSLLDRGRVLDVLIDATEVNRLSPAQPALLGLVAPMVDKHSRAWVKLRVLASKLGVPIITAPVAAP